MVYTSCIKISLSDCSQLLWVKLFCRCPATILLLRCPLDRVVNILDVAKFPSAYTKCYAGCLTSSRYLFTGMSCTFSNVANSPSKSRSTVMLLIFGHVCWSVSLSFYTHGLDGISKTSSIKIIHLPCVYIIFFTKTIFSIRSVLNCDCKSTFYFSKCNGNVSFPGSCSVSLCRLPVYFLIK